MKIRKVDDKNRVTIAADGKLYSESVDENGVITLYPIEVPRPPKLEANSLRAIYVSRVAPSRMQATTITLHVGLGASARYIAQRIAGLADEFRSPVVIESGGISSAIADLVGELTDQEVIEVQNIGTKEQTLYDGGL